MQSAISDRKKSSVRDVFVARQAIFNKNLQVVGYELLFRADGDAQAAVFDNQDQASYQVILDTFLNLGLENIVGDAPAFLNLTRNFFLSSTDLPFPQDRVVLELLEDQVIDDQLIESLRAFSQAGYRIALDDFVYSPEQDPLLEIADIVKLDVLQLSPQELEQQIRILEPYQPVLLAEKVETPEHFEFCSSLGFDLFQGYFLCRPNIVRGQRISSNRLSALRLLAKLQDPNVEMSELEKIIRQDLALSYKLLRLINSAFYSLPTRVESIRQTLVLLGVQQIRSWVSLLTLGSLDDKPGELMVTAMVRAKMCEKLAVAAGLSNSDIYFTVGLFSTLDALLDMPMDEILSSLPLGDEITHSLLEHEGSMGSALDCVLSYEKGAWDEVGFRNLENHCIRSAYLDSVDWAFSAGKELGL